MTNKIWKTLELKIALLLLVFMTLISAGIYYVMHNQYYTLVINTLKEDAVAVHQYAQQAIDVEVFTEINTRDDENKEIYMITQQKLNDIRQTANILYLYTVKRAEDGSYIYVVDGLDKNNLKDGQYFSHAGDLIEEEILPFIRQCLNGEEYLSDDMVKAQWGAVYVAYFPFLDAYGNIAGVIGMEFDCNDLYSSTNRVATVTVVVSLSISIIFITLAIIIIRNVVMNTETVFNTLEKEKNEAEEYAKLMLDAGTICCQLWDSELNIVDCNEAALSLFGYPTKEEYINGWFKECSPEYQPDGINSAEKGLSLVRKAFEEGRCVFEWLHTLPNGTPLPAEVTLVRVKHMDGFVVAGYTRDLREHMQMMREIAEYTDLLHLLNKMSETLLQSGLENFETNLNWCAQTLSGAMGINRVTIWKNYTGDDGAIYCTRQYGWVKSGFYYHNDIEASALHYDTDIPGWQESLLAGNCVKSIVRDLPADMRGHFTKSGVLSMLVVPIFMQDSFWGVAVFDDCQNERRFTEKEETVLRSASQLIASFLSRNEEAVKAQKIYYDALTGIYNRRYLDEKIEQIIKSLSRSGGMLSVMMIDIDHFKKYNDTYGHGEGDNCLKAVAGVLSGSITRTDDFVARYGGEEFVVVLPNTDENGARILADKLLENIRARRIAHENNPVAGYVTFSIGITAGNAIYTQTGSDYIKRADEQLYISKQEGRDRYNFAPL